MNRDIILKSIEVYGKEAQSVVCMEECSELIQAISKEVRGKSDKIHLTEEIADVMICLEMLKNMYDVHKDEINEWIKYKQERILHRMYQFESEKRLKSKD